MTPSFEQALYQLNLDYLSLAYEMAHRKDPALLQLGFQPHQSEWLKSLSVNQLSHLARQKVICFKPRFTPQLLDTHQLLLNTRPKEYEARLLRHLITDSITP